MQPADNAADMMAKGRKQREVDLGESQSVHAWNE